MPYDLVDHNLADLTPSEILYELRPCLDQDGKPIFLIWLQKAV